MVTVTTLDPNTILHGTLRDKKGVPIKACLVQLYYRDGNKKVQDTYTDFQGKWRIVDLTANWGVGLYEARYVGGGLEQQLAPDGDWDLFEITSAMLSTGLGVAYRGLWAANTFYHGTSSLRDLIRVQPPDVTTVTYYMSKSDHTSGATWAADSSNWKAFTNQFDSVATDILLAQDAAIGRSLTMGTDALGSGNYGLVRSVLASGLLDGSGFWLGATADGKGRFRIGTANGATLVSGLLWDGTNFSVYGTIWANTGGFGGTNITNAPTFVNSEGIYVKDGAGVSRAFFGYPTTNVDAEGWRIPGGSGNVVTNGTFPTDLSSWTVVPDVIDGTHTITFVQQAGIAGKTCAKLSQPAVGTPYAGTGEPTMSQTIGSISPNTNYTFSFNSYRDAPLNVYRTCTVEEYNGSTYSSPITVVVPEVPTVWTNSGNYSFVTKSDTISIRITFAGGLKYGDGQWYITDITLQSYQYFTDVSQNGIYIYSSPSAYIKVGKNHAEFVGQNMIVTDLSVYGTLTVYGTTITSGPTVVASPIQVLNNLATLVGIYAGIENYNSAGNAVGIIYDNVTGDSWWKESTRATALAGGQSSMAFTRRFAMQNDATAFVDQGIPFSDSVGALHSSNNLKWDGTSIIVGSGTSYISSTGIITGSGVFNKLNFTGATSGDSVITINADGSGANHSLINALYAGVSKFSVSRFGDITGARSLSVANIYYTDIYNGYGYIQPTFWQVKIAPSRDVGSFYLLDYDLIGATVPHSLLLVDRHGPATYTAIDDLASARFSISSDASQPIQPGTIGGVWSFANVGQYTTGIYSPAHVYGLKAGAYIYASGTVVDVVGIKSEINILGGNSNTLISMARGIYIPAFTSTNGLFDSIIGIDIEDQPLATGSNFAIRFGAQGILAWNSDTFLYRTGPGTLALYNRLGINTAPSYTLQTNDTTTGLSYGIKISNNIDDNVNTGVGILFATGTLTDSAIRGKGAIAYVYNTVNTWNRGDFIFLQNTAGDTSNTTLSDAVMIITNAGEVGIGKINPGIKLDVMGDIRSDSPASTQNGFYISDQGTNIWGMLKQTTGNFLFYNYDLVKGVFSIDIANNGMTFYGGTYMMASPAQVIQYLKSDNAGYGAGVGMYSYDWAQGFTLTIDPSNNQGIILTSPGMKFVIATSGTTAFTIDNLHDAYFNGNVTVAPGKAIYNNYANPGFFGTGYTFEYNVSKPGKSYLEIDNLLVRGEMNVYTLVANEIRATNGALWVTDTAKVDSVPATNDVLFINPSGSVAAPFAVGDMLLCQVWDNTSSHASIRRVEAFVAAINVSGNPYRITVFYNSGGPYQSGDEVVRVGSTTTAGRQNSIYLTASDSNNPYMDIMAGVGSFNSAVSSGLNNQATRRVRLGNLTGITDTINGAVVAGYGLYSDNAFLKGAIVASSGLIAGWTIVPTRMYKGQTTGAGTHSLSVNTITSAGGGNWYLDNSNLEGYEFKWWATFNAGHIILGQLASNPTTGIKTSFYGLQMMDFRGNEFFALANDITTTYASNAAYDAAVAAGTAQYNRIAGWGFDTSKLWSGTASTYVGLQTGAGTTKTFFGGAIDSIGTNAKAYICADGSGALASGLITWDTAGNITSQDYLIERTKLFGDGSDGDASLSTGGTKTGDTNSVCTLYATNYWYLTRDAYFNNLTINTNSILYTNGYRLFVKGTLSIGAGAKVSCEGSAATSGSSRTHGSKGLGGGNWHGTTPTILAGRDGTDGGDGGLGGVGV